MQNNITHSRIINILKWLTIFLFICFVGLLLYGYTEIMPLRQAEALKNNQQIVIDIDDELTNKNSGSKLAILPEQPSQNELQIQQLPNNIKDTEHVTQDSPTQDLPAQTLPTQNLHVLPLEEDSPNHITPHKATEPMHIQSTDSNKYKIQKTKIAILLTNVGLNTVVTELAQQLPISVGIGISPYTNELKQLISQAKTAGHEIFVGLPLETINYPLDDVGPFGILNSNEDSENIERIQRILTAQHNISGVYSVPDEIFTDNIKKLDPLLDILNNNQLLLLYGKVKINTALANVLENKSLKYTVNDLYIDINTDVAILEQDLDKLIEISRVRGKAIGFINAYPLNINILAKWLTTLAQKDIELVPLTSIIHD